MNTDQRHTLQRRGNSLPRGLSSHAEYNDTLLVKASQQGDQHAFALLVQHHQQRVYALSVHLLGDPEEAKEATQEAFLAAWQGLLGFRGDALFSSWLYRIAYHCCQRVLERRTREHRLHEAMQAERTHSNMETEQQAMENIERHEQQDLLQNGLEQLPVTYRLVLHLRYLQERTYEEMADILAMPLGTIKTSLFRAKRLLKERLGARHSESTT
jgi:RNA polymerase sigma-70 factor, ECF subfamily